MPTMCTSGRYRPLRRFARTPIRAATRETAASTSSSQAGRGEPATRTTAVTTTTDRAAQ
jgi:hypothetical protein